MHLDDSVTGGGTSMQAQLIPIDGGSAITLETDVTLVGRKQGLCDLVIDKTSVSKLHCLLVKTDGLLFVRDLGSTNGTKVNGQRVTRGALLPGDELSFASIRFKVHLGPDQPPVVGSNEHTEMLEGKLDDSVSDVVPMLTENDSESDVRLLPDEE